MHFERQNAFQNALNYIFFQKKNVCAYPTLKFSDLLPEKHLNMYLASSVHVSTFRPHKGQVLCEDLAQKQVKIFEDCQTRTNSVDKMSAILA